jgi:magnesium transporter
VEKLIEIFKTDETQNKLVKIDKIEKGCWVNIVSPTEEELNSIQNRLNILPNFLRDPIDEEEKPRIDVEDNQTLIIVDTPYVYEDGKNLKFETIPFGILITDEVFLTICLRENLILESFKANRIKQFYTYKKTRFTFQILFGIANDFLRYLRHIDKKTDDLERTLYRSMRNRELIKLLELQKSLVFFTTSLRLNDIVMEKILRGRVIKMYEEDQDLLEDVIIENKQAMEMANIYSSILNGTMDAFASVISNNLNIVMKFLTSVTIVMAIPTMIYSFYGMNVSLPLETNPLGFLYILIGSLVVSIIAIYILSKRNMF